VDPSIVLGISLSGHVERPNRVARICLHWSRVLRAMLFVFLFTVRAAAYPLVALDS